ncbi:MAG: hypothetical protein IIA72_00155 [Proteobacteria bacterium]|nr:hypothetical protein [Pseudomonadota bacterium]
MSVNDYDEDLHLAIEDIVDCGDLEKDEAAYGVAQQVIHRGYESLSPKQRKLYDAVVVPALVRLEERNEVTRVLNSNPD